MHSGASAALGLDTAARRAVPGWPTMRTHRELSANRTYRLECKIKHRKNIQYRFVSPRDKSATKKPKRQYPKCSKCLNRLTNGQNENDAVT